MDPLRDVEDILGDVESSTTGLIIGVYVVA